MKRLLVLAFLVAACGGATAPSLAQVSATPTPTAEPTPLVVPITPTPTAVATPAPYRVGDQIAFTSDGGANAVFVTVKTVLPFVQRYNDPDPGMRYVTTDILLEGESGSSTVNALDFSMTDAAGYVYQTAAMFKDPALPYRNDLTTGRKVRGWLTWQLPKSMRSGWITYADALIAFTVK